MKTALIYSEEWNRFDYGREHPLRMERLGLTWRLMEAYALTTLAGTTVEAPEAAAESALAVYHDADYLQALKASNSGRAPDVAAYFGLGPGDNPVFPGLWDAARLCAAGSLLAADMILEDQADRVFHFAGGLHHAMPSRASGFCYVNDAVLAILRLREKGLRVLYVDIDAHHGDGVQHAFYGDPAVMTISTHERGEYLFPGTGFVEEAGTGKGVGYSVNLPLEPFTDSSVYLPAFEQVVPPLFAAFRPDVVVAQLGIDAHRTDPLTHLALDVQGFARAVARIAELSPKLICLGGGGYDVQNVARGWTAAWAVLNGVALPDALPSAFRADARRYEFRSESLWDPAEPLPDQRRQRAEDYVNRQIEAIRRSIFPLHRL